MIDWRLRQQERARKEEREIVLQPATYEKFIQLCRAKELPPGSTHYWCWQAICGPIGSAKKQEKRNAA